MDDGVGAPGGVADRRGVEGVGVEDGVVAAAGDLERPTVGAVGAGVRAAAAVGAVGGGADLAGVDAAVDDGDPGDGGARGGDDLDVVAATGERGGEVAHQRLGATDLGLAERRDERGEQPDPHPGTRRQARSRGGLTPTTS